MRRFFFTVCVAVLWAGGVMAEVPQGPPNADFQPAFENQTRAPELRDGVGLNVQTLARGLRNPWGVEVLPDGRYLVTERSGALKLIGNGQVESVRGVPKVLAERQGGLLDVALAEDFETSRQIFLTYSKPVGAGRAVTAAARAVLEDGPPRLTGLREIFVQTPPRRSGQHFGSRIVPHGGFVYITLGDRGRPAYAQDLNATIGKVVRVTPNAKVPQSNPFSDRSDARPEIYSFGHRNPQGADIHPETGDLWTLEHGPAGGDELNRIIPGANYGWPRVSYGVNYSGTPVGTGQSSAKGVTEPRYYWDPVIAPGGFAFYDGAMFGWRGDVLAGSLNPGGLVRLKLKGDRVVGEARYLQNLGRIRDVEIDRDGALLLLVDARDGALVRVTPQ